MTSLSNRVITIYNRKTSMRLAPAEWEAIETICKRENISRKTLFELIDINRDERLGLTSSIRLFSIIYYKNSISGKSKTGNASNEFINPIFEAIKGIV
ncbi:MAG: ribbon-helix-helix domain-containing protein [Alphaproteobacteria bacterium]|nr:ribbon-helix-helix domain-containing protein [Alphaproteobacteria bacterium]